MLGKDQGHSKWADPLLLKLDSAIAALQPIKTNQFKYTQAYYGLLYMRANQYSIVPKIQAAEADIEEVIFGLKNYPNLQIYVVFSWELLGIIATNNLFDYEKAGTYHKKAMEGYERFGMFTQMAFQFGGMARAAQMLGDCYAVDTFLQKIKTIIRTKPFLAGDSNLNAFFHFNDGLACICKGDSLTQTGADSSAIQIYNEALPRFDQALSLKRPESQANINFAKARVYRATYRFPEAITILKEARDSFLSLNLKHKAALCDFWIAHCELMQSKRSTPGAEGRLVKALNEIGYPCRSFLNDNPSVDVLKGDHLDYFLLLQGVLGKADLHLYLFQTGNQDNAHLTQALADFETAAAILRAIRERMVDDNSIEAFNARFQAIYAKTALVASLLYEQAEKRKDAQAVRRYYNRVWDSVEKMRAFTLRQAARRNGADPNFSQTCPACHERDKVLRKKLSETLNNLNRASGAEKTSKHEIYLNSRRDYEHYIDSLSACQDTTQARRYAILRLDDRPVTLDAFREHVLASNQALLSYSILPGRKLLILAVKKNGEPLLSLTNFTPELEGHIIEYNVLLSKRLSPDENHTPADRDRLRIAGRGLYLGLITPIEEKETKLFLDGQRIIYCGDGLLAGLSPDALLPEEPSNANNLATFRFLLHDHAISTTPSATILYFAMRKKNNSVGWLGMSPFSDGSFWEIARLIPGWRAANADSLVVLPYNTGRIANLLKEKGWQIESKPGSKAKLPFFLDSAGYFNLVHIETHAAYLRNKKIPVIYFYPDTSHYLEGILPLSEVYNRKINSDMVTLDGCETNVGLWKAGEGAMTMARAFLYAGSKCVVASNWLVSIGTNNDLILTFYQNLLNGEPKDIAMKNAKIKFKSQFPHFWACFQVIGDVTPVANR